MGKKSGFNPSKYRKPTEESSSSYNTYDKSTPEESSQSKSHTLGNKSSSKSNISNGSSISKSIDTSSSSYISESEIITKGGVKQKQYRIEGKMINQLLDDLKDSHYVKIGNLSGDLKIKFLQLKKIVEFLKETEAYDILLDRINKKFKDIEKYEAGTIGSYCIGCKNNQNCSAACSGSIQHDSEDSPCQHMVILTEKNGNKYNFNILKNHEKDYHGDVAVIYLPHILEEFEGFTHKEKKILKNYGVYNIEFRGYDDEGNTTFESVDKLHIDDCKTRKYKHEKSKKSGDSYDWLMLIIVVIVVFLLIGFFLLWGYWSDKLDWKST